MYFPRNTSDEYPTLSTLTITNVDNLNSNFDIYTFFTQLKRCQFSLWIEERRSNILILSQQDKQQSLT
jgi:hypothetical protein